MKGDTHGERACYERGCRCEKCKAASSKYFTERYKRHRIERGLPLRDDICIDCGESHAPSVRRRWLSRFDPEDLDRETIQDARSCWYPRTSAGERMLFRDMRHVRTKQ